MKLFLIQLESAYKHHCCSCNVKYLNEIKYYYRLNILLLGRQQIKCLLGLQTSNLVKLLTRKF